MNPQVIDDTRTDLIADEGIVLHVYPDSRGILTIGIGCNVDGKHGGGITSAEAYYLCDNRIEQKIVQLLAKFPWMATMDPVRQSAFLNLAFNLGVEGLATFVKGMAAAEAGQWDICADDFAQSAWANEVQLSRVDRVLRMLRTGAR